MRRLLPLLLAVLVVLSGCNGIGLPGTGADPGTDANATTTPTTPGAPGENVTAESVRADALAASEAVETYRLRANQTTRYVELNQTVEATVTGAFDRTVRDAALNQSQTAAGISFAVETYVDGENETLYQYSPAYVQEYDSRWVKSDLSGNFSAAWDGFDTLARQQALLNASNVTLDGVERVGGTDVYVLNATAPERSFDALGLGAGASTNVSNVSATFYVSTETGRLVESTVNVTGTQRASDRTLTFERTADLRFVGYGESVNVDVPDAAAGAVSVGNATAPGPA